MPGKRSHHPRPSSARRRTSEGKDADASALRDTGAPDGTLLVAVRVIPRASRDELIVEGDGLRARLTAPPVEGAANDALVALLADRLRVPRRSIALVRGASSRHKLLAITGLRWEDVRRTLSDEGAGA